ncbi:MAG TPA: LysM domain-containing protein [Burkholderiaceae bacterium]
MKNFSTVGLIVSVAASCSALFVPLAQAQTTRLPSEYVSPERMARVKAACEFRADAPDQHVVVRGDTLWGIAGKFLQQPWCWPEVWDLNQDQISNPHWIYPGQTIYFDRANNRLSLTKPTGERAPNSDMRLAPQILTRDLGKEAIPAISAQSLAAYLSQPLIVEEDELQSAPRIVAIQEGRVYLGKDDKAYVRGDLKGDSAFQLYRPAKPLTDPVTKKVIAYEAFYLGSARMQKAAASGSDVSTFIVAEAKQEIGVGDRLTPLPQTPILNYAPHRPAKPVDARVMSIYGGVEYAGQSQVVTINAGANQGLDMGSVLSLFRTGEMRVDKTAERKWYQRQESIKLPDEQYGTLFVFRVFKNVSYGLIMQVTDTVKVGDTAKSPE